MRNIRLTLSYDGSDFNGWQTQPGFRTVQETLEQAIAVLTGEQVHANASGRTDAGVHAVAQVVNFYSSTSHAPEVLVRAINAHLPADVVADGFLSNMVRAIAGTLINIGRGYWPEEHVARILEAEDRREAGPTAPALGLFLMRVTYER